MRKPARTGNAGLTLSYETQSAILSKLAYLADKQAEFSATLQESGFCSFLAAEEFVSSFCHCEEERDVHRRYEVELARIRFATPSAASGFLRDTYNGYPSAFLAELRHKRDELNGVPYESLSGSDIWKREIDPCQRSLMRTASEQPALMKERYSSREVRFDHYRAQEISRHATASSLTCAETPDGITEFVRTTLSERLSPHKFVYDERRSRPYYPVFSKSLTDNWDLCWSLESDYNLRLLPKYGGGDSVRPRPYTPFDIGLYVFSKKRRGFVRQPAFFDVLDMIFIRHHWLVPAFAWAYSRFEDARDLEVILAAQTTMYSLVARQIETALIAELSAAPVRATGE